MMRIIPEVTPLLAHDKPRSIGLIETLSHLWCKYLHTAVMWPMNGYYHCGVCNRRYPVPWGQDRQLQS